MTVENIIELTKVTEREIEEIIKSFDYESYTFGDFRLYGAKWNKTIADDHENQCYPQIITIVKDDHKIEMTFSQLLQIKKSLNGTIEKRPRQDEIRFD
jgi:hypothetical protein